MDLSEETRHVGAPGKNAVDPSAGAGRCVPEGEAGSSSGGAVLPRRSGYHELHLVSCEFHEGILTLRGRVSSFHLKQVAQELVRQMDGAEEVNNRLEVAEWPHSP